MARQGRPSSRPWRSEPLPLAIRDGRVAQLSVHAVPFALGSSQLQPPAAEALDVLVAGVATDCFLTAQAIGHVRPGTPGEGDTLAAHRLARARSEAVQAALVRAGLPAASVASVWDYQFTTREPRVTLWVFSLPAGDDCKGTPLPGAPARVAAAQPPPPQPGGTGAGAAGRAVARAGAGHPSRGPARQRSSIVVNWSRRHPRQPTTSSAPRRSARQRSYPRPRLPMIPPLPPSPAKWR